MIAHLKKETIIQAFVSSSFAALSLFYWNQSVALSLFSAFLGLFAVILLYRRVFGTEIDTSPRKIIEYMSGSPEDVELQAAAIEALNSHAINETLVALDAADIARIKHTEDPEVDVEERELKAQTSIVDRIIPLIYSALRNHQYDERVVTHSLALLSHLSTSQEFYSRSANFFCEPDVLPLLIDRITGYLGSMRAARYGMLAVGGYVNHLTQSQKGFENVEVREIERAIDLVHCTCLKYAFPENVGEDLSDTDDPVLATSRSNMSSDDMNEKEMKLKEVLENPLLDDDFLSEKSRTDSPSDDGLSAVDVTVWALFAFVQLVIASHVDSKSQSESLAENDEDPDDPKPTTPLVESYRGDKSNQPLNTAEYMTKKGIMSLLLDISKQWIKEEKVVSTAFIVIGLLLASYPPSWTILSDSGGFELAHKVYDLYSSDPQISSVTMSIMAVERQIMKHRVDSMAHAARDEEIE